MLPFPSQIPQSHAAAATRRFGNVNRAGPVHRPIALWSRTYAGAGRASPGEAPRRGQEMGLRRAARFSDPGWQGIFISPAGARDAGDRASHPVALSNLSGAPCRSTQVPVRCGSV